MAKVTLRHKPISGGRQSLYLDYYPPIPHPDTYKATRREFLGLHLYDKPKAALDRQHNKDTLALAENIRAKRQLEVQSAQYGFLAIKKEVDFTTYFEQQAAKRTGTNRANWGTAAGHLQAYFKGGINISELNESVCAGFREHLLKAPARDGGTLARNSALAYFLKFTAALKQAYREGLLDTDLSTRLKPISKIETRREYLTLKELQALVKTDCKKPILKQAAIFSALTGLRFSDIHKLTWKEVQHSTEQGYYIRFRQQKTQGVEVLPISEQAYNLLGEQGEPETPVFKGLLYSASWNNHLRLWVAKAGITKDITFHCFRHTYATLQLTLGTDIYTVSKMLGHRDLRITQVYAKIVDKAKREAADKIKLDFYHPCYEHATNRAHGN